MIEIEALGWVVSIDPTAVLAPGMFLALVAALLSGFPVAFCLGGIGVIFALLGMLSGEIEPQFVTALPQRILGIMANFTLLAIPAFVFMGAMLESSGIAERLLDTMGRLLGRLRGGLALAVVLVGCLLAATTGVVAATVTTMGLISLPAMLRAGYDKSLATGVIVASGTLGQIIPPSIVLVVLGDQLGISVGDLFIGALIPGLLMAAVFAAYVLVIAALKPHLAPQLPAETNGMRSTLQLLESVLPPLSLIVAVLGSIFFGIATPTEAGVIGGVGLPTDVCSHAKETRTSGLRIGPSPAPCAPRLAARRLTRDDGRVGQPRARALLGAAGRVHERPPMGHAVPSGPSLSDPDGPCRPLGALTE